MTFAFEIWDATAPIDRGRWIDLHSAWTRREVFAHPAYVELFVGPTDRVFAAYASTPNGWILYPYIVRELASGLADLTTAYGYGGPFCTGDGAAHADAFWSAFGDWASRRNIVSEFIRFSLFDEDLLAYPGDRQERLQNVVRSLEPAEADIWSDFDHKVRKNVNKARRGGVTIEIDTTGARLDDFLRIYETTMDRREAQRGYYFSREFFEGINKQLPGQFVYLHALLDGRVVSTELALVSASNVYSYLGGTDETAFDQRPNDLLKHELILWAKNAGKRRLVLGGGYSVDDGIYRYKRAFAPTGTVPFFTGSRVLDRARYDELVTARTSEARAIDSTWNPEPGFFPAYRAHLPSRSA